MFTKKQVLISSFFCTLLFAGIILAGIMTSYLLPDNGCRMQEWCNMLFGPFTTSLLMVLTVPILVFFFSLITYKMREEVFRAWWRFARWFAPVIVVVTLLLERAGSGGGIGIGGAVSAAFDILVLGALYAVLIIVSLIQIARAYFKSK